MMKRFLIVGPYGGRNLGDDLILEMILEQLDPLESDIVVSCSDPERINRIYNVPAISLLEYRKCDVVCLKAIKNFDAVIIGGGEQLSEPRIPNPLWGHLARTSHVCRVASANRVPCMLWAVGLDELKSNISKLILKKWVLKEDIVCAFRDSGSFNRALEISRKKTENICRVADPVYLLEKEEYANSRKFLFKVLGEEDTGKPVLMLVPANDKMTQLSYLKAFLNYGKYMVNKGWKVVGWVTDLQEGYDLKIRKLDMWHEIPGFKWLPVEHFKGREMAKIIRGSQLLISLRMHPLIIALTQDVPCVPIMRSAKMEAMATELCLGGIKVDNHEIELFEEIKRLGNLGLQKEDDYFHCIDKNIKRMRELATKTFGIFNEKIMRM